jgi:hypothetical protein
LAEDKSPIRKVTIEKINLGVSCQRVYHVIYCSGFKRTYNVPSDKMLKFIKENQREMSKVSYIFTDRSDIL